MWMAVRIAAMYPEHAFAPFIHRTAMLTLSPFVRPAGECGRRVGLIVAQPKVQV
jgi:hypothetical protein